MLANSGRPTAILEKTSVPGVRRTLSVGIEPQNDLFASKTGKFRNNQKFCHAKLFNPPASTHQLLGAASLQTFRFLFNALYFNRSPLRAGRCVSTCEANDFWQAADLLG